MSRKYPNLSLNLDELMIINGIDKINLSQKTEIKMNILEKMLKGDMTCLNINRICKLAKAFDMLISECIDYLSR